MLTRTFARRAAVGTATLVGLLTPFAVSPASAEADQSWFFEETAEAFWAVPHTCEDGSVVPGTLVVRSTRDYASPDTEDANPTARVQYLAFCQNGGSARWGGRTSISTTHTSTENLKSVTISGEGLARDDFDSAVFHPVSFSVEWTGVGPLRTEVDQHVAEGFSLSTNTTKKREATATGRVIADGAVLVDGADNHPTRPAPYIETYENRRTRMP